MSPKRTISALPLFNRRALCALGVLAVVAGPERSWAVPGPSSSLPTGLKQLLSKFRNIPGLAADFEEEKNIALLAAPLKAKGQVYFHPPHSLARIVTKPRPSHLVISKERIVVKDESVRKEVDLSDKPALRGLISSLLHVLAGDEKSLLESYLVEFSAEGEAKWRLRLVPKSAELRGMVKSFVLAGQELKLSELRVSEASGDETITRFSNVNEKRTFSKAEISRFFEI